jgi:exodeoxyribonuclease-3
VTGLSLLTLNIGNPSPERARRQLAWLARRDEHILVLTETKASAGCRLLAEGFAAAGYAVHWPQAGPGEYGTMIAATVAAMPDPGFGDRVGYLPPRAGAVILPAPGGPLRVIGLYVPAGVRGPAGQAVPRGSADRREPAGARPGGRRRPGR